MIKQVRPEPFDPAEFAGIPPATREALVEFLGKIDCEPTPEAVLQWHRLWLHQTTEGI